MGLSFKQQKFVEDVGLGNEFDDGLLDIQTAGYELWFERRTIDDIISRLRRTGHPMGAEYLEQGPVLFLFVMQAAMGIMKLPVQNQSSARAQTVSA
jgi:hypothetical protein